MRPWKCVVCEGSGRVAAPTHAAPVDAKPCHACHGSGVLWSQEFIAPVYPSPPYEPKQPWGPFSTGTTWGITQPYSTGTIAINNGFTYLRDDDGAGAGVLRGD